MEKTKILQASLLDIIFDGRNKVYGAYELRNKYSNRLTKAIFITGGLALMVMLVSFVSAKLETPKAFVPVKIDTVQLKEYKVELPVEIPPPPQTISPPQQLQIQTSQYTNPPQIIKDELVEPEDVMKDVEDLTNTQISTISKDGNPSSGITEPPIDEPKTGVIIGPKVDEGDKIAIIVQIQAKFPGGEEAWKKYISREIGRYMDELQEEGKAGSCMVQFVVDKDGVISDVEALTMKGTKLAEIAVNAIRKGPKWSPAENNGKKVKAYRRQPVTFQLINE